MSALAAAKLSPRDCRERQLSARPSDAAPAKGAPKRVRFGLRADLQAQMLVQRALGRLRREVLMAAMRRYSGLCKVAVPDALKRHNGPFTTLEQCAKSAILPIEVLSVFSQNRPPACQRTTGSCRSGTKSKPFEGKWWPEQTQIFGKAAF